MTQHIYPSTYQGKAVTVLMGWDRPLQGYFMTIEAENSRDDQYVYCNLDDPELFRFGGMSPRLAHFRERLQALGLSVPQAILDAIERDARANAGNLCVQYNPDGTVRVS